MIDIADLRGVVDRHNLRAVIASERPLHFA